MPKIERIRRRHLLKKRDKRAILERLRDALGSEVMNIDDRSPLEAGVLDDGSQVLLLKGKILFFESEGRLVPTLRALLGGYVRIPTITVDMGAVRFVVNGADIMKPGVTRIDDRVSEGSVVAIVDEQHGKPLAVGFALMDASVMQSLTGGKVVVSKHHVGDALWEFGKM